MKSIAILTGPDTYLDHLGVICYLMNMPLIVTEEETFASSKKFYPQVTVIKKEIGDLSSDFLANNFDVIFESGKFFATELKPVFNLMHNKNMRFVFCPHGNSDKGHSAKNHVEQDVSLVYGKHMLNLLRKTGAIHKIAHTPITGNYRLPFYLKYKSFYDDLVIQQLKLDKSKKTILYAPTWQDGENPSSFFFCTKVLIEQLKDDYNVIIKLHPFLEEFHPAHTYHILESYKNTPGITFLSNFPSIYPLLAACDIYIGDYSSIGYDFLAFDKPLYFLTEKDPKESTIHPCGLVVPAVQEINSFIKSTIEKNQNEKQEIRQRIYEYAFGKEISFSNVKKEILRGLR
jgi:hypothetical protein